MLLGVRDTPIPTEVRVGEDVADLHEDIRECDKGAKKRQPCGKDQGKQDES